jgi:hypothetical protein
MADLSYQQAATVGADCVFAAAAGGGDTVPVSPRGLLIVRNADATSKTVTVVVPGTKYGQALPDITKVITTGNFAVFGPFPADLDNGSGLVNITYSDVTSVTVAAVQL